jgi:hypothetical protein
MLDTRTPLRAIAVPMLAVAACTLLVALAPTIARADAKSREILDEVARRDRTTRSWKDRSQKLQIRIVDYGGGVRERELAMKTSRSERRESKTLLVVLGPADQRGIAILQHSHRDKPSEQWLYQPLWGRKREVSPNIKGQRFVGSDFTIQDLEILADAADWTEAEVHSSFIGDATVDGLSVHVIELTPGEKSFGYSKLHLALDEKDLLPRRLEMFDEDGNQEKVLTLGRFETIDGIPTPLHLEMNVVKGGESIVDLSGVRYDQNLAPDLFEARSLERGSALNE